MRWTWDVVGVQRCGATTVRMLAETLQTEISDYIIDSGWRKAAASSFAKFLASARNLRDGTERTLGEDETAASGQTLGRARCRPSGSTSAELDPVRWVRAATPRNEAVMLCNTEGLPGDVNLTDG
jgi:hypothetical protein